MEFLNNVFEQRDKPISDSSKKLLQPTLYRMHSQGGGVCCALINSV